MALGENPCAQWLKTQLGEPPDTPKPVHDPYDVTAELAMLKPEFAHRRVLEGSVAGDGEHLRALKDGKYVYVILALPDGTHEMRVGPKRFEVNENAHGHGDIAWGFPVWAAGELILSRSTDAKGELAFDIQLNPRSGTYRPEPTRLIYAASWLLDTKIPIQRLELTDEQGKTLVELWPENMY